MNMEWLAPWWRTIYVRAASADRNTREEMTSALIEGSSLSANYVVLILASCAIATFGLLENSPAVIIGAMIIAPLMPVIEATAYGALEGSAPVFWRAVITLTCGVTIAVALSAVLARSVGLSDFGSEILSRTRPNLLDLGIALAAGAVGGFARVRPSIANTVAGTAIAVALMPPLCVVGIGIAAGEWQTSRGALLLFITNLLGITRREHAGFSLGRLCAPTSRVGLGMDGNAHRVDRYPARVEPSGARPGDRSGKCIAPGPNDAHGDVPASDARVESLRLALAAADGDLPGPFGRDVEPASGGAARGVRAAHNGTALSAGHQRFTNPDGYLRSI